MADNQMDISMIDDLRLKQIKLEEKINHIKNEMITNDVIENYKKEIEKFHSLLIYINDLEEFEEKFQFFRLFISRFYSDIYNWKSLAQSIYHIEYLINNLDNYQIKEFIQKQFQNLLNYFILFIKDLITIQIKSHKQDNQNDVLNSSPLPPTTSSENLKNHINNLKAVILTAKERFNICQTDIKAIETLLQSIDNINFDSKNFNKQDEEQIHILKLKQDLSLKSNKTDLIQLKTYLDNQIKKLIQLNKQNAKDLQRLKLLKTSSSQAHHIQKILSTNPSKTPKRIYSHQSSKPYITFELDSIRKYQRQALLKTPYGTIPLYRRQAWAAANLFENHSLHYLRYLQNSLRLQIHHLLGYNPSDIYNKTKLNKKRSIEIFYTNQDISIVGNNNKLYRGRVDSCQIIPLKNSKDKKMKIKSKNIDENNEKIQIQLDQTINNEHLYEYFDWQTHINEQDLPDELYEELFQHWKSILCENQICICNSELKLDEEKENSSLTYDNHCICSQCSCNCEKSQNTESICPCSQCSCKSLNENQDTTEVLSLKTEEINLDKEFQPNHRISVIEEIKETQIISDCFINRIDRWTQQFDYSQLQTSLPLVELDDPTIYRQKILDHHREKPN